MKKCFISIPLILLCHSLFAQSYSLPDTLEITDSYWVTGFAPIGWSRDGKVAFITYDEVDGRGGTIIEIVIMDAVSDKVVWSNIYDTYDEIPEDQWGEEIPYDFEAHFHSHNVQSALSSYGIESSPGTYREFPFTSGSYTYHCAVRATYSDTVMDLYGMSQAYDGWDIFIGRDSNNGAVTGQKIITSADYDPPAEWLFSVGVVGCIKSPFEERVLVIYSTLEADFEEPQSYYHFSGAHLNYGYGDTFESALFGTGLR